MKKYDSSEPFVFIHIPKTAGSSVKEIFRSWFVDGFVPHYVAPSHHVEQYDICAMSETGLPHVIYGHFNHKRGFGVLDYCPNATQFMTVMRNPWDQRVSGYFYSKSIPSNRRHPSLRNMPPLQDLLLNPKFSQLDFFPREVSKDNYKEIIEQYFVAIGTTEKLQLSLEAFARALGRDPDSFRLDTLNTSEKDEEIPEGLKQEFRQVHSLECEIYDYICQFDPFLPNTSTSV